MVIPDWVLSIGWIDLLDYLNCVQTNNLRKIYLLEIELLDHLRECKKMIDV